MKGQKRLVREVGRVKDSVESASAAKAEAEETAAQESFSKNPEVTIQQMQELEEKQKKNLKAHLIALDMKEQGNCSS